MLTRAFARGGISLAALVVSLAVGTVAYAHAMPTKFVPGGAVLTTAPKEVNLDTGEEMQDKAGVNDLIVGDASGKQVTTTAAVVDDARMHMSVALPDPLVTGTYTVRWFTVGADDGHEASGSWHFTYDPTQQARAGTQPEAESGGSMAYVIGGVLLLMILIVVGVVVRQRRA